MTKELEALERLKRNNAIGIYDNDDKEDLDIIETALTRLEEENEFLRKDNENLDETYFETWRVCEELKKNSNYALMFIDNIYCLVDTKDNKFEVIDNYKINSKGIIENKKLKALEIIKEKRVDCFNFIELFIKENWTYDEYVRYIRQYDDEILTQEEFDLLKEVLL